MSSSLILEVENRGNRESDMAKLSKGLVQPVTGTGKEWALMKLDEIAELPTVDNRIQKGFRLI